MSSKRNNILKINQQSKGIRQCRNYAQDRLKRLQTQLANEQQQKKSCPQQSNPLKVRISEVINDTRRNNEPKTYKKSDKELESKTHPQTKEKLRSKYDNIQREQLISTKKLSVPKEQNVNVQKRSATSSDIMRILNNQEQTEKCAKKRPSTCNSQKLDFKIPKLQQTDKKPNLPNAVVKSPLQLQENSMKKNSKTEFDTPFGLAYKLTNNKQNFSSNKVVNVELKKDFPFLVNPTGMVINSDHQNTIKLNSTTANQFEITNSLLQSNKFLIENKNSLKDRTENNRHVQRHSVPITKDKTSGIERRINIADKIASPTSTKKITKNVNIFNKNIKCDNTVPSTSYKINICTNSNVDNNKRDESFKIDNKLKVIKKNSANSRLENLRQKLKQVHSLLSPDELKNLTRNNSPETSLNIIRSCKTTINSISTTSSSPIQVEPMDLDYTFESGNNSLISTKDIKESTMGDFYDTVSKNILRISAEKNQSQLIIKNNLYFVVDTNILLNNLAFLDDLIKFKFCETNGTIIYVPYIVLQELDKLKMRTTEGVSTLAARAIKFINEKLESNVNNVLGQSSLESNNNLIEIQSPDDKIINCCLQLTMKNINFLLLSNDINLRNKAILNKINVSTKSDLVANIFKDDSINFI